MVSQKIQSDWRAVRAMGLNPGSLGRMDMSSSSSASQLKAFRAGTRKNLEMNLIAKTLSEADIANVAAYFAGLPGAPGRNPR